jgi:curved DNA-binding protein CbpA
LATVDSKERALEVLRLRPGASPSDVEKRFRELVKEAHSDHGGRDDDVAELVAARDLLRDNAHTALVPVDHQRQIVPAQQNGELVLLEKERQERESAKRESEGVTQKLVRAEVTRIESAQRRVALLAWLGGGTAAALVALRSTSVFEVSPGWEVAFALAVVVLIVIGGSCAAASFFIKGQIATNEQAIEDAAAAMTDRPTFLDLMYELVEDSDDPDATSWSAAELKEAIRQWSARRSRWHTWLLVNRGKTYQKGWIRKRARRLAWSIRSIGGQLDANPAIAELALLIGPAGFYRLLIAKGDETRLLKATETVSDGRLQIRYQLTLSPESETSSVSP